MRGRLPADADEDAVQLQLLFPAGKKVFHGDPRQPVAVVQLRHGAVPQKFHIFRLFQRLMVDLRRPQGVSAVDEDHFFRQTAQHHGIRRRGIAAADDSHGLAPVEHSVAGGAVMHAPARQLLLLIDPQQPGVGAGGQDHRAAVENTFAGLDHLGILRKLQSEYLRQLRLRTEALRAGVHLFPKGEAVDALFKAGIIVDLMGQRHLAAGRKLLQNQRIQTCSGGV